MFPTRINKIVVVLALTIAINSLFASVALAIADSDSDGVLDSADNCLLSPNPLQRDTDSDGYGNFCDPDFDNNLIVNAADLAYTKTKFFTIDPDADLNGDGIVNAADLAILKTYFFREPGPGAEATYTVGGQVTGLIGSGLLLQNNSGDDLSIGTDGPFVFSTELTATSPYVVTVLDQPDIPAQTCTVLNGSGVIDGVDIADVMVRCITDVFPVLFDSGVSYSNQIYVDTTGDDVAGDGSTSNPYKTLAKAASVATPGTQIILAAGLYDGGLYIFGLTGTDTAPIAIIGDGNVTISSAGTGLMLSQPRYVVLDNLTIQGGLNGLNIDDGGEVDNPLAAEHVIVKNSTIYSTGLGNNDAIKASGVNHLYIVNNQLSSVGIGSSNIDLVGCHNGIISQNTISNSPSSGIQTKGGSADILIHGNMIRNITGDGGRAINAGGSTGFAYFRPPLIDIATDPLAENYEAARITMLSNIIVSSDTAVAYVGCIDCVFANNTVIDPQLWIVRILQETVSDLTYNFVNTRDGYFMNNIVRYTIADIDSAFRVVNIGSNTSPETFTFNNNLWWATDQGESYVTQLPAPIPPENASLYQLDPLFFNAAAEDYHIGPTSPAIGQGVENYIGVLGLDYDQAPYRRSPALGAFEGSE
jgi:hypothetical protein